MILQLVHYLLTAPLPSFLDWLWSMDGDCFRC